MVSLLLVDGHPVVREGVAAIVSADAGVEVVGQAGTAEQALALAARLSIDVGIIDTRLPDMAGTELCAVLRRHHPRIRSLMFAGSPNERSIVDAFAAGACGFVAKDAGAEVLRQAVTTIVGGGTFIDPRHAGKLVSLATQGRRAKGPFGLTMQEMRVLELLPKGLTNRQIGRELGVSEQTIKSHLSHAMRKLQVSDRAEAAAAAIHAGLA
jgi:DNA-binding NarL/FixJ family response regulator